MSAQKTVLIGVGMRLIIVTPTSKMRIDIDKNGIPEVYDVTKPISQKATS